MRARIKTQQQELEARKFIKKKKKKKKKKECVWIKQFTLESLLESTESIQRMKPNCNVFLKRSLDDLIYTSNHHSDFAKELNKTSGHKS